jgi:hypothetical protein
LLSATRVIVPDSNVRYKAWYVLCSVSIMREHVLVCTIRKICLTSGSTALKGDVRWSSAGSATVVRGRLVVELMVDSRW